MKTLLFRQCDVHYPPFWEDGSRQRAARWHSDFDGPAQYLSDTADGAWAELLRHEEITEPIPVSDTFEYFSRVMWCAEIELPDNVKDMRTEVTSENLFGDIDSYPVCQQAARQARDSGNTVISAPSAALVEDGASGWIVKDGRMEKGPSRSGSVFVVFSPLNSVCWRAGVAPYVDDGLLKRIRFFSRTLADLK